MKSEVELKQEARRGRRRRNFPLLISFPEFQSRKKGNKKSYNIFLVLFYFMGKLGFRPKLNLPFFCSFFWQKEFFQFAGWVLLAVWWKKTDAKTQHSFSPQKSSRSFVFSPSVRAQKMQQRNRTKIGKRKEGKSVFLPFLPFSPYSIWPRRGRKKGCCSLSIREKASVIGGGGKRNLLVCFGNGKKHHSGVFFATGKKSIFLFSKFSHKKNFDKQ